jgi:hypothetical protein
MPEVRYDKSHHAGATAEARIQSRLKSSGGDGHTKTETHPTRTVTTVHHGQNGQGGQGVKGE